MDLLFKDLYQIILSRSKHLSGKCVKVEFCTLLIEKTLKKHLAI